jgi:CubicO group peptidase (beta-lactamase class C family)
MEDQCPRRDNSDLYPSGGLVISARDLAVFADAIFNGDFLQPETLQLFTTAVTTPVGTPTGYSFGWQIGTSAEGDIEWYGHGGEINGAYASVMYYPASKLTIVGMTNYNYWLTSVEPEFFHAVRKELPALFAIHS